MVLPGHGSPLDILTMDKTYYFVAPLVHEAPTGTTIPSHACKPRQLSEGESACSPGRRHRQGGRALLRP